MSSNVGLATPRGSGTSGYVQRNLSHLKPRDNAFAPYPRDKDLEEMRHKQRQPDKKILQHDREREIEVEVFELQDQLEDEGVDEDEISLRTTTLRKKLLAQLESNGTTAGRAGKGGKGLKAHQVHELAAAKIEESEKLRRALGIREDYREGEHWKGTEGRLKGGLVEEEGVKEGKRSMEKGVEEQDAVKEGGEREKRRVGGRERSRERVRERKEDGRGERRRERW